MFSVAPSDVRQEAGISAAHRRQNDRRGRLQRRSAQNCGIIHALRAEKSLAAYPTFYLPQRTSRFTMRLGSAQASRRVTDLATAPIPHFPGVGATSFSDDNFEIRATALRGASGPLFVETPYFSSDVSGRQLPVRLLRV
jgi:hypothetical protein